MNAVIIDRRYLVRSWRLAYITVCVGLLLPSISSGQEGPAPTKPLAFAATFLPKSRPLPGIQKGTGAMLVSNLPVQQIERQFGKLRPGHIDALRRQGFFLAPSGASHSLSGQACGRSTGGRRVADGRDAAMDGAVWQCCSFATRWPEQPEAHRRRCLRALTSPSTK